MVTKFVLNRVLHHVGLSWIFESTQQLEYGIEEHIPYQLTDFPWYNISICTTLYGAVFRKYIRNARTERFIITCYIDAHDKQQPSYVNTSMSGGDKSIPPNFTT